MESKKGRIIATTPLVEGAVVPLSDLQISASDSDGLITMVSIEIESEEKNYCAYEIKPGCWRLTPKDGLIRMDLPDEKYFVTATTEQLMRHFDVFKNNLDKIRLRQRNKRGILLGSEPGTGKSALIRHFCRSIQNPRVCILRVDSDEISFESLTQMFMNADTSVVDFVFLILEDIGGTALHERHDRIDSAILNFLDGNSSVFRIPTLIVGTTNFLDELGRTLTDRPGRFDYVIQVEPPKDEEAFIIAEGSLGRPLSDDERKAIAGHQFTPAYVVEIADRHDLYDMSISDAVKELLAQREKARKKRHEKQQRSMGFSDD